MKIGLVSVDFFPMVGGVAAHVFELGKALVRHGHEVDVIAVARPNQPARVTNLHGMRVFHPRITRHKPFYSWLMNVWLRRYLQGRQLDVVHVHGLRPLEATRNLAVPVVFTNHTSGFLKRVAKGQAEHRRIAARLSHVAHVLAPSDELATATRTVGYRGPVDFIPNGVDTDRFSPGSGNRRDEWTTDTSEVVVLLARRLVEKNGVTVFAEALTRLKDTNLRLRPVFAGDGPERSTVQEILANGGMLEACRFLGNVDNSEMPDIYRSADISVLPSFMEATSITGLESMASGVPLIGTRVGGIPVLIADGTTGLLIDPGDASCLARTIESLAADESLRLTMGARARERAVDRFSWERIAAETAAIYSRHADRRAAA